MIQVDGYFLSSFVIPLQGEPDSFAKPITMDESYIGGTEEDVVGRQTDKKAFLICAVEKYGRRRSHIRLGVIEDASAENLKAFIDGKVALGSMAHTERWSGYNDLERSCFRHLVTVVQCTGK